MVASKFLLVFLSVCSLWMICNNGVVQASHKVYPEFQSLRALDVQQVHRTGFHFQPSRHWINGKRSVMPSKETTTDFSFSYLVLLYFVDLLSRSACYIMPNIHCLVSLCLSFCLLIFLHHEFKYA